MPPALPASTEKGWGVLTLFLSWAGDWLIRALQLTLPVAGTMKDDVALLATVTLVGVLMQGHLRAKGFPRVAAAHLWPSRVRARLPSPGQLQRVLPAVPRHALGRRHLLPRRRRSPVRTVLPVRALPILPRVRALGAAQAGSPVRERARTLAAGGDGCAGLAGPLPPRYATRCALPTAPGAPADDLRRRTSRRL
ncbi:leukotriene C4 synthase isoform X3 [Meriones unguiculatus]|nr:leukotriene C4 synthase isoform X3 [Meriones unguiculatus]